eukprot:COSAG02_NODE_11141_length_1784_cov_1.627300_1_plen_117_part_00
MVGRDGLQAFAGTLRIPPGRDKGKGHVDSEQSCHTPAKAARPGGELGGDPMEIRKSEIYWNAPVYRYPGHCYNFIDLIYGLCWPRVSLSSNQEYYRITQQTLNTKGHSGRTGTEYI